MGLKDLRLRAWRPVPADWG